jgi:XTP/dITP diphosphohydrolase
MSNLDINPSSSEDSLAELQRLMEVVAQLRSPDGGCPWDLAQTPQTLIPYVIEEAYEVVDAIRSGDRWAIAEELGDLLLQVVLQSQIASEHRQFTLADVARGITDKLIRRHPHVFAEVVVDSLEQVRQNWEQIKATEKGLDPDRPATLTEKLSRYHRTLPPLTATMKISQKAAAAGFEWDSVARVWQKVREELTEFEQAIAHQDKAHQQAELGDVLFAIVQLARWYDLDPSEALQGTQQRFIQRLTQVEQLAERPITDYSSDELDALWQQAKRILADQGSIC